MAWRHLDVQLTGTGLVGLSGDPPHDDKRYRQDDANEKQRQMQMTAVAISVGYHNKIN